MDIFISLLKATALCAVAYYICHFIFPKYRFYRLSMLGRLSRSGFFWRLVFTNIFLFLFTVVIDLLYESVTLLPSYWLLKSVELLGYQAFAILFASFYSRRLQDFAVPGIIGLAWTGFLLFSAFYGVVKSTALTQSIAAWIGNIILFVIPGTSGPNPYGSGPGVYGPPKNGISSFRHRSKTSM